MYLFRMKICDGADTPQVTNITRSTLLTCSIYNAFIDSLNNNSCGRRPTVLRSQSHLHVLLEVHFVKHRHLLAWHTCYSVFTSFLCEHRALLKAQEQNLSLASLVSV